MGRKNTPVLSEGQRAELTKGVKTGKSHASRSRCQLILLKAAGRTSKDVGEIVGMCHVSVNSWLKRYNQEEAMRPASTRARLGAPRLASGHAQAPFKVQRADERVRYAALLQEAAQGQRAVARVLHAHQAVTSIGTLLDEPKEQSLEARRSVGELVVGEMVETFGLTECRVDSGLGERTGAPGRYR